MLTPDSYDHAAALRQEMARREDARRRRLNDALDAIRDKSTRTDEEVAELRARLERLAKDGERAV